MAKALYVDEVRVMTTRSRPPRLIVNVKGRVTTTGWTDARLEPYVYITPPQDGLMDFDLVATPPTEIAGDAQTEITAAASLWMPAWCRGVRVHASANEKEAVVPGFECALLGGGGVDGGGRIERDPVDAWPWLVVAELPSVLARLAESGATSTADARVSDLIGRPARCIREGDIVDMMYLPDRVTIVQARDSNVIVDIRFG